MPSPKPFGVYVHIPWCLSKCPYCDFASRPIAGNPQALDETPESLARELEAALRRFPHLQGRPMRSTYLGGGTPSLLEPRAVGAILDTLKNAFPPAGGGRWPDFEATVECNPASAEPKRLEAYRQAGINRISLGIQSFRDRALGILGRAHDARQAEAAARATDRAGLASWSLDLMFALPGDSPEGFQADLEMAIEIAPPHLSVYGLTLHEGTPMWRANREGRLAMPDEETQRALYLAARDTLRRAGYEHYEISNFARPGHRARHNALTWQDADYLGLGPAAHSCIDGRRYANPAAPEDCRRALAQGQWPASAEDSPTAAARRGERIMLALRRLDGVALSELDAWLGCDFAAIYAATLSDLVERGLLAIEEQRLRLTTDGILVSDAVFGCFF